MDCGLKCHFNAAEREVYHKSTHCQNVTNHSFITRHFMMQGDRGGVRSTRGLGPTVTARGQSIGISIGMLPQTLIMSRMDRLSRLGARI